MVKEVYSAAYEGHVGLTGIILLTLNHLHMSAIYLPQSEPFKDGTVQLVLLCGQSQCLCQIYG